MDTVWKRRAHRPWRELVAVVAGAATIAAFTGAGRAPAGATGSSSSGSSLGYDAAGDTGSMYAVAQMVGAPALWAKGYTGKGIGVALIDTGVTEVPGLDRGNVVDGPDLSFDSQSPALAHRDSFGHGTHMASIIAGRDANAKAPYNDPSVFNGIAPDATLLNVKVGATDGSTDVSQVIAAIDWVVQHKDDPGLNIKVINLSFGTESKNLYKVDPLAFAVEQAWKRGIFVVAAAGNDGINTMQLADPAYDPRVLAVGGDDPDGTLDRADDDVPDFATHGNNTRKVDVIAPATHVLGLRVPGSYVDSMSGNTGQVGARFQRGSGTSEAAAVTSGVMALLAQYYPKATPDELKQLVMSSAFPLRNGSNRSALFRGHGVVDAANAMARQGFPTTVQTDAPSTGTGRLELSRGGVYVSDNGVDLTGERDVFGSPWSSTTMAALEASASSWTGGTWNGSRWSGDSWDGSRWSSASWTGSDWAGSRWSGSRWSGMTWDGSRWSGSAWNGSRWSGSRWSGSRWSSSEWQ